MGKYYAVLRGKRTGIFRKIDQVEELIKGEPYPEYNAFSSLYAAERYFNSRFQEIYNADSHIEEGKKKIELERKQASKKSVEKLYLAYSGMKEENQKIKKQNKICKILLFITIVIVVFLGV